MTERILIIGAAGRDFHNFNVLYKNNKKYKVVGFTAAQIPNIAGRKYPKELAGKLYPKGIKIFEEKNLEKLIKKLKVNKCVFSYSDVSAQTLLELIARCVSNGADFELVNAKKTMIKSKKKIISICATRTGCGKSQTTRYIAQLLKAKGLRVVSIRHPMPYGDLTKQTVQRFAKYEDLKKHKCTIEEREEYEPIIRDGMIVYAGVDYEQILKQAEKEADVILWDGGNNDTSFYKPDLSFVITDPFRPGHELKYYPGNVNFLMANVIIINKVNSAPKSGVKEIITNAKKLNPKAKILLVDSVLSTDLKVNLKNKKVICIEDGPTVTHGELDLGAALIFAQNKKAKIVPAKQFAVGEIKKTYAKHKHLNKVLPAMGYGKKQIKDLKTTIEKSKCDYVISGTPIELQRLLNTKKTIIQLKYELKERTKGKIAEALHKI